MTTSRHRILPPPLVAGTLLALFGSLGSPTWAQTGTNESATRAWPARLARPVASGHASDGQYQGSADSSDLETFIVDAMATKHIPGLQAAIVKDGQLAWSGAFGQANPALAVPVDETTLFMLASISKTVTGTTLLQLADQGLFDLDDPVNDHLPFAVVHPSHPATEMTVRMVLSHTASLKDNWGVMPYYPGDSPYALGYYLENYLTPGGALYNATKNFYSWAPATGYGYCNNGLALAGHLVEVLTGQSFDDVCTSGVFAPLGMDASAWFLADLDPADVAMPCRWNGSAYVAYEHYGYSDYPSGQLRTTATELARFLTMIIQDGVYGAQTILQTATAQALTTPQFPGIDPTQGLVLYSWTVGGRTVWGHGGGDQGVTTEMWFDPATDIGIVALTNGEAYFTDIIDALFDYADAQPPATSLTGNVTSVSLSAGGLQNLTLDAGATTAGWVYWVLGSATGTSPGLDFGGGAILPLNFDPYFKLTLTEPLLDIFGSFIGTLDDSGGGSATLRVPSGADAGLAGITLHHAFLAAPAIGGTINTSNAVSVLLTP